MIPSGMMDETRVDALDLAAVEAAACDIVMLAAATLRERFAAGIRAEQVEYKDKQQRDPVTAVDRAMESLVRTEVRRRFPSHGMLGEEGTGEALASELLWVLDPIDGTANFAAGLPMYGLSLGLLRNGAPIVGAVYVPFWPVDGGAVLSASLGHGARIAGKRIRLDATDFRPGGPVAVPPGLRAMFQVTGTLAKRPGEARNLGSIVAELAMVATGGFQYAVFGGPKLWDVAAGALIVREAGGVSLTWEGGRWRPIQRFRAPRGRPGKPPPTLRDWVQPVLVAGPGAASHVGSGLRPRPRPTKAVRWLMKQRKAALDFMKKTSARLTGKATPATGVQSGAAGTSPPHHS